VVHDWHLGHLPGPFDLAFLADVTYRPVHHRPILQQMQSVVAGGGVVIHADPYRRETEGFLVQASRSFVRREIAVSTHWRDERHAVRICGFAATAAALDRWLPAGVIEPQNSDSGDGSAQTAATGGARA
jgi:hypothetical protein